MKFIKLLTSAYVGGVLRHPDEGVLHVTDADAHKAVDTDKIAEDVTADFATEAVGAGPVETISAPGAAADAPEAPSEPHQSEVAPQATEDAPKPGRKAAASKE